MRLSFRVNIDRENDTRPKLSAACLGTSEPFLSITRCVSSRPNNYDLAYLLVRFISLYWTMERAQLTLIPTEYDCGIQDREGKCMC
jgi:hypothetical protein